MEAESPTKITSIPADPAGGRRNIVSGEHGDLLALEFHGMKDVGGHMPDIAVGDMGNGVDLLQKVKIKIGSAANLSVNMTGPGKRPRENCVIIAPVLQTASWHNLCYQVQRRMHQRLNTGKKQK
ncbi:MAG: hypothetical protein R2751_13450 [Bacteroidales bacterium]